MLLLANGSGFGFRGHGAEPTSPYPPSPVIRSVAWHWDTYTTAAPGSDLWPTTWGPDDNLYAAWGDGGGFRGTDSDGRVATGFARIEGWPTNYHAVNVNGGKEPVHPATFEHQGKTSGIAFVDGILYAALNLEDGKWPQVNHVIVWSTDQAANWTHVEWLFAKEPGSFQPAKFLSFGKDYSGVPTSLAGYVYLYGPKVASPGQQDTELFLARVPRAKIRDQDAYEYLAAVPGQGAAKWVADLDDAKPVFTDRASVKIAGAVYCPALKRYLLTAFHSGPGQLGIFDAPEPWGPWTTVSYEQSWGRMGSAGEGLGCEFPPKWMSSDGRTVWCVFSVYGDGAKIGIKAHDRFNLVKVTLTTAP